MKVQTTGKVAMNVGYKMVMCKDYPLPLEACFSFVKFRHVLPEFFRGWVR
jgi:hypothetical protein